MNTENAIEINDEILLVTENSNIRLTMSASEMTNNSIDIFEVNQESIQIQLPNYNKKYPTL
jgi:hypothetical protein